MRWSFLACFFLFSSCIYFNGLWKYYFGLALVFLITELLSRVVARAFDLPKVVIVLWVSSAWVIGFYFFTAWTAYPNVELGSNLKAEFSNIPHSYYDLLTKSIANGYLDLGIKPSPEVTTLLDPYNSAKLLPQCSYPLDASIFKGKYYIYYGLTPVLTLFLPFYKLTGLFFPGALATAIFCSSSFIFSLLGFLNLWRIHQKEARSSFAGPLASSEQAFLTVLSLGMGSFATILLQRPHIYQIAQSGGICFGMLGIFALTQYWIKKGQPFCFLWLGTSGLSFAMAVGSRPQQIVCILSTIVLFFCLHQKQMFGVRPVLWFGLPYAAYGSLLAAYNYLRFGSWIEFGRSYILGGWD